MQNTEKLGKNPTLFSSLSVDRTGKSMVVEEETDKAAFEIHVKHLLFAPPSSRDR